MYEYQDEMEKDALCVAEDGTIFFLKHIENMTQDSSFLCVLDEQFQTVAEIETEHSFSNDYDGEYDEQLCARYVENITDDTYFIISRQGYVDLAVDVQNGVIPDGLPVTWFDNCQGGIGLAAYNPKDTVPDASVLDYDYICVEGKTLNEAILDIATNGAVEWEACSNGSYICEGYIDEYSVVCFLAKV